MPGGKKKGGSSGVPDVSQLGLGIPDLSSLGVPGLNLPQDEDDATLEAELAALMEDDEDVPTSRAARARAPPPKQKVPMAAIDKMAADAMKSVDEDDDEDIDDPDLLAELDELNESGPSPMPSPKPSPQVPPKQMHKAPEAADIQTVLKDRLDNYRAALTSAEAAGETSKARRYARGAKTLTDLMKKAQTGKKIDESEIPPQVAVMKPAAPSANLLTPDASSPPNNVVQTPPTVEPRMHPPTVEPRMQPPPVEPRMHPPTVEPRMHHSPAESVSQPPEVPSRAQSSSQGSTSVAASSTDPRLTLLHERRNQYKTAALQAKKAGDVATASEYIKVMKQFDMVITAVGNNEEVDLSNMPPPPGQVPPSSAPTSVSPAKQQRIDAPDGTPAATTSAASDQPQTIPGMPQPKTVLEALQQREARYKEIMTKAKAEENTSKARRMGRAHKQYVDAIKKAKSGRPIDYNELPSLPDFPPIPIGGQGSARPSPGGPDPAPPPPSQQQPPPALPPKARAPAPGASVSGQTAGQGPSPSRPAPAPRAKPAAAPAIDPKKQIRMSANQKQLQTLHQRKKKLMAMALKAKKEGDMEEAKRLLKMAKGFDPMIEAAENGLPVNMESIPDAPGAEETEELVEMAQECVEELGGDPKKLYSRLKETLTKQIQMCESCEKQYAQLGNVATVKRFRDMRDNCQQDLDVVLVSQSHGDAVPRFHYEMRTIPSIRVNDDLRETEAEVVIIQGMGYKSPSGINDADLDTYVKFEFPYPTDNPQSHKCGWGKGAENPTYNGSHKVQITRSRTLLSVVKRKAVKFEIYYRKGLLRGDKLLGVANLKLADLENKCEAHDSVQLHEGRKPIAGKLEAKVRIHHPLSGVKEDHSKEKWLVIDAKLPPGAKSKLKGGSGSQSHSKVCMLS
ncbi:coiled-coil and C2 domain-containing protein 1-like isoform X2 [Amphiura filiformis]|uniref:coiled-coil and C2 domain-containing protein 1-like isoform X2 n=1 Tax=Amphiura filiformis TaxID=82378 RepID=UPI003B215342